MDTVLTRRLDPRDLPGWQAFTLYPEEPTMTTVTTATGRTREVPLHLDPHRVVGLDEDGRLVVDDYGARDAVEEHHPGGRLVRPFMFGLTLCCDAYDKGVEDGVVCRACFGDADTGHYLFRAPDGSFPGLDPVVKVG